MVQPRLLIEHLVTWEVGRVILAHFAESKEPVTFTMKREGSDKVRIWMSKRTSDWLREVLELDPRAHKEAG